nr:MAG TPA: hypothetical protein [Caudoviricetes sp.]
MIFSYHPLYPLLSLGYRYILFVAFSIFAPTLTSTPAYYL